MEREQALEAAVSQIERQFGKGAVMKMGDAPAIAIDAVSTGALSLDLALGIGGLPRGRVCEVFGPESSGKTTLCYHVIAEHGVVDREVVMRELAAQCRKEIVNDLARIDGDELAAEAAGGKAQHDIDDAVGHQEPHGREMPQQRPAEPITQRNLARKHKAEQRRGVVDLPARADHEQHRERIDPVRYAHPARVNDGPRGGGRCDRRTCRCLDGHGFRSICADL